MENSIKKRLLEKLNWIRGYGLLGEAFILFIINYYLITHYDIIKHIEEIFKNNIISTTSIIDSISISISLILAVGFLYYVGFITALRIKNPTASFGDGNLMEVIKPIGAIFFLAIFLPLLLGMSNIKSDIIWYIVINIFFAFCCGFVNEFITQQYEENGFHRDQR